MDDEIKQPEAESTETPTEVAAPAEEVEEEAA